MHVLPFSSASPLSLHPSVHCASFSSASKDFCCGLSDSSIHLWSQLPMETTDHMTTTCHQGHTPLSHQPIELQRSTGSRSSLEHHVLLGHHGSIYSTCFNSSGQFLLSASEDCSLRLWDVRRQSSVVCYRGHAYPVWDVSFW